MPCNFVPFPVGPRKQDTLPSDPKACQKIRTMSPRPRQTKIPFAFAFHKGAFYITIFLRPRPQATPIRGRVFFRPRILPLNGPA